MGNSFRQQPTGTLYPEQHTPVTEDLLQVGLLFAFAIIAFSFILIIPGIRGSEVRAFARASSFCVQVQRICSFNLYLLLVNTFCLLKLNQITNVILNERVKDTKGFIPLMSIHRRLCFLFCFSRDILQRYECFQRCGWELCCWCATMAPGTLTLSVHGPSIART